MPRQNDHPSGLTPKTRSLTFGIGCLALAIVAGLTASWIPLVVLVALGAVSIAKGSTMKRS